MVGISIKEDAKRILNYTVLSATLFIIATYLISIPLGIYVMYAPDLGLEYSQGSVSIYIIAFMLAFPLRLGISIAFMFAFLIAVYSLCFYAAAKPGQSIKAILGKPWKGLSTFTGNWLISMPLASSMLLLLIGTIQGLQESAGVPTGSISLPNPYEGLFSLAYSPIIEEIGFRLTPIGAVVAVYLARRIHLRMIPLAVLWPDEAKKRAELASIQSHGLRGITIPEWVAAIATSSFFGLVHYLAGGGWDVGKISTSAIAGMAFAIIYLWKGIHASILLHWFFDYYGYIWDVADKIHQTLFNYLDITIYALTLFLGLTGWLGLTWRAVTRLNRGREESEL